MRSQYHPPDLELARLNDPRLEDPRLHPQDLNLVVEEMVDLGLDPDQVDEDQYLKARDAWINLDPMRGPEWLRKSALELQARENEHKSLIDDFLSRIYDE